MGGGGIHGATAGEDEEVWEMKRKGWRTGGRRGEAR